MQLDSFMCWNECELFPIDLSLQMHLSSSPTLDIQSHYWKFPHKENSNDSVCTVNFFFLLLLICVMFKHMFWRIEKSANKYMIGSDFVQLTRKANLSQKNACLYNHHRSVEPRVSWILLSTLSTLSYLNFSFNIITH